jgi:hypothetical protein
MPGMISFARLIQVLLGFGSFIAIISTGYKKDTLVVKYARIYILSAYVTSIYGVISYVLLRYLHVNIGGAYGDAVLGEAARLRGGFNEGGPFGLFAAGAVLLLFFYRENLKFSKVGFYNIVLTLFLALILAFSKAGIFLIVTSIVSAYIVSEPKIAFRRIRYIIFAFIVVVPVFLISGFGQKLGGYYNTYVRIEQSPLLFQNDPNAALGRIAGFIIVPRMIVRNPVLGVGIGNYSLTRNNPVYRGLVPYQNAWDLPGLGLYGDIAELGIPAGIVLAIFFLSPAFLCRRKKCSVGMMCLTLVPFLTLVFGAEETFLYPWILYGIVTLILHQKLNIRRNHTQ